MRALKCLTQPFQNDSLVGLLRDCLALTYNAMNYGEEMHITNRKGMKMFYQSLRTVGLPSCYKAGVITRACAILKSREKSKKRGVETFHPRPIRPMVCIISGFFVTAMGRLFIPLKRDKYVDVQLNHHVLETLQGKELRSLTITSVSLSICYSEEIESMPIKTVYGVDRNEKNLTFGNTDGVVQIGMSKAVKIRQTTREIVGSFKRNDTRLRKKIASKYWKRASHRTDQMLHAATNLIVDNAAKNGAAITLEDLKDIRKMFQKANRQGTDYRFRLNTWPYGKAGRMLEYKSAWKGVTTIQLTKSETRGSSSVHHACGEKLHKPEKGDALHRRMLWCQACRVWMDRDVNAAIVLSKRGLARFASSLPRPEGRSQRTIAGEEGPAGEAMKGNPMETAILRVDASKLGLVRSRVPDRTLPSCGLHC
ncbi:MAG: transposase [Thaumarchaeota archaeon]|nr:transposase [Nitrososphaerota archaeon]